MRLFYAGIGSKSTPQDIQDEMKKFATIAFENKWILRSGCTDGADSAFESGVPFAESSAVELFVPWKGYSERENVIIEQLKPLDDARLIASQYSLGWEKLSPPVKLTLTCNVRQILGDTLDKPVSFVLCWTSDGCESRATRTDESGSTGLAIALADAAGIPIINMKNERWQQRVTEVMALKADLNAKFIGFDSDPICEQASHYPADPTRFHLRNKL